MLSKDITQSPESWVKREGAKSHTANSKFYTAPKTVPVPKRATVCLLQKTGKYLQKSKDEKHSSNDPTSKGSKPAPEVDFLWTYKTAEVVVAVLKQANQKLNFILRSDSESETDTFPVKKRDELSSNSTSYLVRDFIGEGAFGKVARCINLSTDDIVAVKILKKGDRHGRELKAFEKIRALDPDKNNFVRFIESFKFNNISCLAFEMLDKSLFDMVCERSLCVNEIRPVTHQMLVALKALADIGIFHTDVKPDNIMLVNHKDQPFRVKLIDFGMAGPVNQVRVGTVMQLYGFRAPEVMWGLPLSEAIDMWGLGCTLAFLYFGKPIFPINCSYYSLREMVRLLGPPEARLLRAGVHTWQYFIRERHPSSPSGWGWRFKSRQEYQKGMGIKLKAFTSDWAGSPSLEWAVQNFSETRDNPEYQDRMQFLGLLKSCLHWNAAKRITAGEALKHSFVTMTHLDQTKDTSSYRCAAHHLMSVCPMEPLDEGLSVAAGLTDGATASISLNDGAAAATAPVDRDGPKKKEKKNLFQRTRKFFHRGKARAEITGYDNQTGPSMTTDLRDGGRDTAAAADTTKEVSAAATNNDSEDTDCMPAVTNTNDDGASAAAYTTDGAAASISLNDGAAAAVTPVNMDGLTKRKKKKNLFRRTLKFLRRVKARAEITSHEIPTGSSATTNLHDGVRDTAAPAIEVSAAGTNDDSTHTDCVPTVSCTNDGEVSATAGSSDGAAAIISLSDRSVAPAEENLAAATNDNSVGTDCVQIISNTNDIWHTVSDGASAAAGSTDGAAAIISLSDGIAAPAEEDLAAPTSNDSTDTDCVQIISNTNDIWHTVSDGASAAAGSTDGAAAIISLSDGIAAPAEEDLAAPTSNDSTDTDCVQIISNTNDIWHTVSDGASVAAGSTDGAAAIISLTDGIAAPAEEDLAAATNDNSAGTDCVPVISTNNDGEVSAATGSTDGVAATISSTDRSVVPPKEYSAAATDNGSGDTDCGPTVINSNNDGASAAVDTTDGVAASISLNDGAAAAITLVNMDGLTKKKKKKNLFQRTLKFFRRVRAQADITSHENPTGLSVTNICDGAADTAAPTKEVSAAATNNDSTASADCLPTVGKSNDYSVLGATVTADGAAASVSLNDGAVAAVASVDVDGLKKRKKKKNLFQRTFKWFG
ncbi:hypothetical protein ABVT39_015355 [Epinephelus coioides]